MFGGTGATLRWGIGRGDDRVYMMCGGFPTSDTIAGGLGSALGIAGMIAAFGPDYVPPANSFVADLVVSTDPDVIAEYRISNTVEGITSELRIQIRAARP